MPRVADDGVEDEIDSPAKQPAGTVKLKTTTVQVQTKSRRVAAKKAARPSRGRKPA